MTKIKDWTIKEQTVEDLPSGLILHFEARECGEFALKIFGDLPLGNRTLVFDTDGNLCGSGTHLSQCPTSPIRTID